MQGLQYLSHLGDLQLTLSFVHTGNVFVKGGICKLGGFENTIMGYRTKMHNLLASCKDKMDVIMFGELGLFL